MSDFCLNWRQNKLIPLNIFILIPIIVCIGLFISFIIKILRKNKNIIFTKKLFTTYMITCLLFILCVLLFGIIIFIQETKYCNNIEYIIVPLCSFCYPVGLTHMYLFFYFRLKFVFININGLMVTKNENYILLSGYIIQMSIILIGYVGIIIIGYYSFQLRFKYIYTCLYMKCICFPYIINRKI